MTSVQHHIVTQTHSSSNQLDNHLDALLDDLQTSVSRPAGSLALSTQNGPLINGSAFGGGQINLPPGASGYREVTTTVTRDTNGMPMTSKEYQIEYLNPANTVTVLDDRSSSPALDLLKSGDLAGHQLQSYKTEVYDYKFSKTTTDKRTTGYGGTQGGSDDVRNQAIESKSYYQSDPQLQDSSHFSRSERSENVRGETNVSKNLNELDMLLKELNNSPSEGANSLNTRTIETRVEKSPGRYAESPSTMPKRSASATREVTYTERTQNRSNRAQSPTISSGTPKAPARTINVQREYNTMESRSHTSRRDSPSARSRSTEMSPTLRRRTPSPSSGEFRPSNFSNYPISPKDLTPTRTVTSKSYGYSSTGRRTPTPTTFDEPQPYRSPSPVSFPQKRSPSPVRRNLSRSDSGRSVPYQVSPPPASSDNPTVITYKYSSHSREQSRYPGGSYDDRDDTMTRPFPTSTPIPAGEQSPPKKLDELMASFQDSKSRSAHGGEYTQGSNEYTHKVEYARDSHERHGGDLQRSPSFERNLRPSNVKVTQTYSSQQQQQQQEYQNQYQQREQYQQSQNYQQREQTPGSYHREYQRREEYHTREHPGQYQQQQQQQQQREQYEQQQREQYQQSQYQQYHQSQGGYQREQREQYHQNQGGYQQNQQYQYQQNQQYQHSSQMPVNDSMTSSQAYRSTSASKSVAGPPVYYPPGVELFTKKEEAKLMQEQSSGKGKSKGKSKSGKGEKSKGDKGKGITGVPMCLPVCCAMPCSIM